ncbi:hypothetical protein DFP72DRAFT_843275 [Ephemerocybe angulata]|uniref:Uncharacterized protein n=1 Tax=Ephemerocybe angulata TaxID=980116 RepID=A0A8H6I864_9AGAR|nr:hypothetical protein DFP72DRAFT_843275 [Tulosesus angulatus]
MDKIRACAAEAIKGNGWKRFSDPSVAHGKTMFPKMSGDQGLESEYHLFKMQPNGGKIPSAIKAWRDKHGTHAVMATVWVKKDADVEEVLQTPSRNLPKPPRLNAAGSPEHILKACFINYVSYQARPDIHRHRHIIQRSTTGIMEVGRGDDGLFYPHVVPYRPTPGPKAAAKARLWAAKAHQNPGSSLEPPNWLGPARLTA